MRDFRRHNVVYNLNIYNYIFTFFKFKIRHNWSSPNCNAFNFLLNCFYIHWPMFILNSKFDSNVVYIRSFETLSVVKTLQIVIRIKNKKTCFSCLISSWLCRGLLLQALALDVHVCAFFMCCCWNRYSWLNRYFCGVLLILRYRSYKLLLHAHIFYFYQRFILS
jgi:hypothetical protein